MFFFPEHCPPPFFLWRFLIVFSYDLLINRKFMKQQDFWAAIQVGRQLQTPTSREKRAGSTSTSTPLEQVFSRFICRFLLVLKKKSRQTRKVPCSSWWLNQPMWTICSSKWIIFPKFSGSKITKKLKPAPTLPETNIAPGKGDSYWKPPFLGAMLVSGSVVLNLTKHLESLRKSTSESKLGTDIDSWGQHSCNKQDKR